MDVVLLFCRLVRLVVVCMFYMFVVLSLVILCVYELMYLRRLLILL